MKIRATEGISIRNFIAIICYVIYIYVYEIDLAQIRLDAHKSLHEGTREKLGEINSTNYANRERRIMSSSEETLANSVQFEKLLVRHE